MQELGEGALAIAMLAALLLAAGGIKLVLDPRTRKQGALMIVAALVMVTNVMIWTV